MKAARIHSLDKAQRNRAADKPGRLIAALDIGSTKICCMIARLGTNGQMSVVGLGHHESEGIRGGSVVSIDDAALAIGKTLQMVEEETNERIVSAFVNLSGIHTHSNTVNIDLDLSGGQVTPQDIRYGFSHGRTASVRAGETDMLQTIPLEFTLDGLSGVRDPIGMFGKKLGMRFHALTANRSAVRNVLATVNRCHLDVDAFCVTAFASGLACLVDDEMDLGCTIIDMGGGTTNIGVFLDGSLAYTDCIPLGGGHITQDIARGLTTPIASAERIKALHGCAWPPLSNDNDYVDVPQIGEDQRTANHQVSRSLLTGIIQPRMEEIFEMVRACLDSSGLNKAAGRRVVLTGGASQMQGTRELAQRVLDKQARVGQVLRGTGPREDHRAGAYATASGLLTYAAYYHDELPDLPAEQGSLNTVWQKLGNWFKQAM